MNFPTSFFSHSQQIITQDFARNQVSSQTPQQPPTSTFQNSPSALVSTPVRTKTSNRYSPESQVQSVHHQRPGSRVSPENLVDKSRGRYDLYSKLYINFPTVKQMEYIYRIRNLFLTTKVHLPLIPGKCKWALFPWILFLECPLSWHLVLCLFNIYSKDDYVLLVGL